MNIDMQDQIDQFVSNLTRTDVTTQDLFKKDGKDVTLSNLYTLRDNLISYYYYYGTYPHGFDEDLYNAVNVLGSLTMINDYDNQYGIVKISKLIESIYNKFDAYFNNTNTDLKYYAMSCHDSNITPIQVLLNLTSSSCVEDMAKNGGKPGRNGCMIAPEYATNVVHELSKGSDGYHYMRVLVNGKAVSFCPNGKIYKDNYCRYNDAKTLAY